KWRLTFVAAVAGRGCRHRARDAQVTRSQRDTISAPSSTRYRARLSLIGLDIGSPPHKRPNKSNLDRILACPAWSNNKGPISARPADVLAMKSRQNAKKRKGI